MDMDKYMEHTISKYFADDAKFSKYVKPNKLEDKILAQNDLNGLIKWQDENNAKFNSEKFVCMKYNQKTEDNYEYEISGVKIKEEKVVRDLGILVNNKGTFEEQIESVAKQCNRLSGMIFRTFMTRDKETMITLLKTIILPRIDYCSILWAPTKIKDMRKIEKIQSNFTKRIKIEGIELMDYNERRKVFKLYSIERRFERYFIIYMWKILNNMVVNPGVELKENYSERTGITFKVPKHTMKKREDSFFVRGPKLFNSLPKEIREFPVKNKEKQESAVNAFKYELDKYLSTIPDEPNLSSEYGKRMTGINTLGQKTNSIIRILRRSPS